MGEQTPSQSQTQTQNPIVTHHDSTTTTTTTDLLNAPPPNPSPLTNIPLRPRKIRKLSPESPKSTKTKLIPHKPNPIPKIVPKSLSSSGEIETALKHLRSSDPKLAPLISTHQPPTFDSYHPPFLALTRSILYQQLAYKAGTSIYNRFVSLCGGESAVVPNTVLSLTPQQLRQVGVSCRKTSYLHDLSRKYQNGILSDSSIVELDDKSLFTMLTMVNGIGSWSVHMFMIFSLHRPDVLPINDLGVRKGVQILYGLDELPRPSQMEQLCEKWRPYRSVGAWYMWRLVEPKGPGSSGGGVTGGTSLQLQQQQQQFLDPISGILNLEAYTWGQ